MPKEVKYVDEPENKEKYTKGFDTFYSVVAKPYELFIKISPFWKRWLKTTIPHIQGPRVLEVSFGTGYLLTQYADQFDTYGIDYNEKFVSMLQKKLAKKGFSVDIRQGNVEALPYKDGFFDSIVNTMAFSAYPDAVKALSEMHRVLKPGGKLMIVDIDYPLKRKGFGMALTKAWILVGDLVRDMTPLFNQFNFEYTDEEIGGFGSVHLYVANKL